MSLFRGKHLVKKYQNIDWFLCTYIKTFAAQHRGNCTYWVKGECTCLYQSLLWFFSTDCQVLGFCLVFCTVFTILIKSICTDATHRKLGMMLFLANTMLLFPMRRIQTSLHQLCLLVTGSSYCLYSNRFLPCALSEILPCQVTVCHLSDASLLLAEMFHKLLGL